jgi:hypothetical protein
VRTASPSRRAAGLLAVTTIGLSTAVLSVTGVASAAPAAFTGTVTATSVAGPNVSIEVPDGYCAITWTVRGGQGGSDAESPATAGDKGGELRVTTEVAEDDVFLLQAGQSGGAAGVATAGGHSGTEVSGQPGDPTNGSGGGASTVRAGGTTSAEVYLLAVGGNGAGTAGGAGGGDGENFVLTSFMDGENYFDGVSAEAGHGSISYTGVLCSAPPAPEVEEGDTEVGENSITVRFFEPATSGDDGEPRRDEDGTPYEEISGYEVKVDGGNWAPITPVRDPDDAVDEALYATVTGLSNGTEHTVQLRTTSVVGSGGESVVVTATPVHTYPAPVDVKVTAGVKSLTVNWKAPAVTTGITGWSVEAYPLFDGDPEGQDLAMGECTTEATDYTCTFPVKAGWDYAVIVSAMADGDYRNTPSADVYSGKVPGFVAPTTVPSASAPLTTTDSDKAVKVGEEITVSGSGYLPNSSVDIVMYSTPQVLKTVLADGNGNFTATVTVPAGLANGTHHLVAAGVDENGNPRYLVVEVTVSGGVATVTSSGLAYTGFTALPFVGAGVLALGVGGGLLVASRRRQA